MKKIFFCALLIFLSFISFSQNIQTADYYIGLGERYIYKKQTDSAIWAFKYVLQNFPNKTIECNRATFKLAGAYEKDSPGVALKWYYKIVNNEKISDREKGMEMFEPYANYKHNSCVRIATILGRRKNFDEGLRWLEAALYIHKYQTYLGNAFESRMVNIAITQSDYYKQLGFKDSAVYILVQKIFDTNIKYRLPELKEEVTTEADYYGKISTMVAKMIDQDYGLSSFKFELNKAWKKIKVKKDKNSGFIICTFKLYNITYKIISTIPIYKKQNFINDFKASKLWLELEKG